MIKRTSIMVLLMACGGSIAQDDTESVQSSLEAENGGMTASSEAPSFGDPNVDALDTFTTDYADTSDMATESMKLAGVRSYRVALVWGHLPPARDAEVSETTPTVMNWDGSVSVDSGGIGLLRTARFELGDHVVPRTDAKSISFVSHTLPHVDGLFLHVVVPADTKTLHFATKSLTTDIDLDALSNQAGGIARMEDGRNGLFWVGYRDDGCARGLLFGRWRKLLPRLGSDRGIVVNGDGNVIGHVRGVWGHSRRLDDNVFFGKYIERGGEFRGLLGGHYGDGQFSGVWGTVKPSDSGTLEGYYSDGYERGDGRGVFVGRWRERCER